MFAYNMEQCVSYHSVGNTIFAVEPTEHKTKAPIEQEASE